jgi:tetratricopeptide (TPR) repeat protein
MKTIEQVEVKYVRLNTALIIGLIGFILGFLIGNVYDVIQSGSKIVASFDKALSLEPGLEQAWFNKGIVLYYDQGKKEAGRKLWEELSRKNPLFMTPAGKPIAEFLKTL